MFEAKDRSGRTVAVKTFTHPAGENPALRERLLERRPRGGDARTPEPGRGPRRRRAPGASVRGHRDRGRGRPRASPPQRPAAAHRMDSRRAAPDHPRSRRSPSPRPSAPRPEALRHPGHRARRREGLRLRGRAPEVGRAGGDRCLAPRHPLSGARDHRGPAPGRPRRRLLGGRPGFRARRPAPGLSGRRRDHGDAADHSGRARPRSPAEDPVLAALRGGGGEEPGSRSREALRLDGGVARRPGRPRPRRGPAAPGHGGPGARGPPRLARDPIRRRGGDHARGPRRCDGRRHPSGCRRAGGRGPGSRGRAALWARPWPTPPTASWPRRKRSPPGSRPRPPTTLGWPGSAPTSRRNAGVGPPPPSWPRPGTSSPWASSTRRGPWPKMRSWPIPAPSWLARSWTGSLPSSEKPKPGPGSI